MYDGPTDEWLVRETGIMVAVPEIWGHFFVGRTKEGFSLNKVMVGYAGWTHGAHRRSATPRSPSWPTASSGSATCPSSHLLWNLGSSRDWLSEGQSLLHLRPPVRRPPGLAADRCRTARHPPPRRGERPLRQAQRRQAPAALPPEAFTGAVLRRHRQLRLRRRRRCWGVRGLLPARSLLFGTEYFFQKADAPETGDPLFHGGDVVATWLRHRRDARVQHARRILQRGFAGADGVRGRSRRRGRSCCGFSYIDLDGGTLRGGKFWRFTPMVNWHLSDNARLELAYGYGSLDRFGTAGKTQFFQSRLQLQL